MRALHRGVLALLVVLVSACGGDGSADRESPDGASTAPPVSPPESVVEPTQPTTTQPTTTGGPITTPPPSTEPPPATVPAGDERAILRSDGIGPFDFGAAADDVEAWAVERFGAPDWRVELRPPLPQWADQLSAVELDGDDMLWISWPNGLRLAFSDRSAFRDDGAAHFAWWAYSELWMQDTGADAFRLTTLGGFGLPASAQDFLATYPSAAPLPLACDALPYSFVEVPSTAPADPGLRGLWVPQGTLFGLSAGAPPRCPPAWVEEPQRAGELFGDLQLDGSGVVGTPFGTPIDQVRARVEPVLGPPNVVFRDTSSWPDYRLHRGCYLSERESTQVAWTSPELSLWFHDGPPGESDGVVRFVYWSHGLGDGTPVIATPAGVRPGLPIGDVVPVAPTLRLAPPGDCGCHRVVLEESGPMTITTDWNSTEDVQRALVAQGYPVEVTGEIDEPTIEALNDFLADLGLEEGFTCGCADFRSLTALGITLPAADAIVTSMSAGTEGTCDCGC